MDRSIDRLLMAQMDDVQGQHPALELLRLSAEELVVRGVLGFRIDHEGRTVEDSYEVEIDVPSAYPLMPPRARETGGVIPDSYHHKFVVTGYLCLGAPVEIRKVFAEHRTMLGFINRQVIPYLFSYSYFREFGRFPHGELRHGSQGVLDYYSEHFGTGTLATLRLLKYLADFEFRQGDQCPCGSHRELSVCHGRRVLELWGLQSAGEFAAELVQMIMLCAVQTDPLDELWWVLDGMMPKHYPRLLEFWSEHGKGIQAVA